MSKKQTTAQAQRTGDEGPEPPTPTPNAVGTAQPLWYAFELVHGDEKVGAGQIVATDAAQAKRTAELTLASGARVVVVGVRETPAA